MQNLMLEFYRGIITLTLCHLNSSCFRPAGKDDIVILLGFLFKSYLYIGMVTTKQEILLLHCSTSWWCVLSHNYC